MSYYFTVDSSSTVTEILSYSYIRIIRRNNSATFRLNINDKRENNEKTNKNKSFNSQRGPIHPVSYIINLILIQDYLTFNVLW